MIDEPFNSLRVPNRMVGQASRLSETHGRDARATVFKAILLGNLSRVLNTGEATPELAVEQPQIRGIAELVDDDETIILLLRPSILYIPLSAVGSLMFIALIALAFAWMARTILWVGWTDSQAFGFGAGLVIVRLGWQYLEWLSRVYVLTDRRIIRRMGVLRVTVYDMPLKNIQHTAVFVRLRERMFTLGSVGFATAGSDTFEAFWVMIRRPFDVHKTVLDAMRRYGR